MSGNNLQYFEQTHQLCQHCGQHVDVTPAVRIGYFMRYDEVVALEAEIKRLKALLVEASIK